MEYFVELTHAHFVIKQEKLDAAYKAMCELNAHNDLKGAGHVNAAPLQKPASSTSVTPNPNRQFVGLDWDYDVTCTDARDIFDKLDFFTYVDEHGDLYIDGFAENMGDEEHFLRAVAPFVEDGCYLEWQGAEGDMWKYVFNNGEMKTLNGTVSWH